MKETIIVEVSGGVVQAIHSSNPDIEIFIVDHDNDSGCPGPMSPDRLIDKSIDRYLEEITY